MNAYSPKEVRISKSARRRGVALVVVLGMLVLVLVLVVAFLSSVSVELQSAKKYSGGADARALADSAVSLVISQIQDATTNPRLAWASQPGMVRTFDSSGAPTLAYKLYSSGTMRVSGSYSPIDNLGKEVPDNWSTMNALYTDLNKPVAVSGTNRYPILDPSAVAMNGSGGTALVAGSTPIEGCYVDTNNGAIAVSGSQTNVLPMPVQWLYVLNSGSLVAMNPATGVVSGASKTDPIVGRIAFWTDDESSKININTASEGTFWDRPWTRSPYETSLNNSMPMRDEYQRFPGHPAMTSLSVVFPPLDNETTMAYNERIYSIVPRIAGGGSKSGSVTNTQAQASQATAPTPDGDRLFSSIDEFIFNATSVVSGSRMPNASGPSSTFNVADLEKVRFFLTANSRAPEVNLFNKPRVSLWPLQVDPDPVNGSRTRTAKDKLIAFCSTIGTLPYYIQRYSTYSFEENRRLANESNWTHKQAKTPSSQSPRMDWTEAAVARNEGIFRYLRFLMAEPIPGLGGTLAAKYPNTKDQILVQMFDYIRSTVNPQRTLDNQAVVGGDDVEYFYAPGFKRANPAQFNVIGQQQVAPLIVEENGSLKGRGFGRFPTIKQAVMVFQASNPADLKTKIVSGNTQADAAAMKQNPLRMRAVLLLEPFNVTPGTPVTCPNIRVRVQWIDSVGNPTPCLVNNVPLDFPQPAINLITARDTERNMTATGAVEYSYKYYEKPNSSDADHSDLPKRLGVPAVGAADEEQYYPFYTSEISVPGVSGTAPATFEFKGGTMQIDIFPGYSQTLNEEDCVQTIRMSFPRKMVDVNGVPTEVPIILPRPSLSTVSSGGNVTANVLTDFDQRLARTGLEKAYSQSLKPLIINTDTVRALEATDSGPAKGDLRVFAALREVPASYFKAAPLFDSLTARVHQFRIYPYNLAGNNSTLYNGFDKNRFGKLVAGVTYYDDPPSSGDEVFGHPIVPSDLAEARMIGGLEGDWDTGPGTHVDGPFINKADMGDNGRYSSYYNLGNNPQTWLPNENGATYSPNRQIASAVAFGSLPTGIDQQNQSNIDPWRTLLFGRHPAAGKLHPGFGVTSSGTIAPPYTSPPDHAFLDFFTMPIVEPYAISEPFSTAGKVNMNYQIAPFTYLTRNTGIRAVLKSTLMTAIPTGDAQVYKQATNTTDYRYTLDPDETRGTLVGLERRFQSGDIFRSATEICDISLVPKRVVNSTLGAPGTPTYDAMDGWWSSYRLTGDNVRELPYGHIYPRLTTKSNTFTVHVIAQSIAKANSTPANQFVEGKDQVTGEFRGSFLLERYLDPNADFLVKADQKTPGSETDLDSMVGPYKFRVISSKRFAP
jgi:uncharacterized protein (TIGR02600 family)